MTDQETVFCPYCNAANPSGAAFCRNCGKKLDSSEKPVTEPKIPPPQGQQVPPPPPIPPTASPAGSPPFQAPIPSRQILITNTENVIGGEIEEVLGLVQGNTVRAKHIGKDIVAQLKNIVGGEVTDYTTLFSEAREEAIARMTENAIRIGADAVINVRFVSSMISQGMSELLAYGTAVKLKKEKDEDDNGQ